MRFNWDFMGFNGIIIHTQWNMPSGKLPFSSHIDA